MCSGGARSTLAHTITECPAFAAERDVLLSTLASLEVPRLNEALRREPTTTILGGEAIGDLEADARATAMRAIAVFCDTITKETDKVRNAEAAVRKRKRTSRGRNAIGRVVKRKTSSGTHTAKIIKYTVGTTYHRDRYLLRFPPGVNVADEERKIGPQAVRATLVGPPLL